MKPMKLGLIGNAGAGKDTFGEALAELGYEVVQLKGPLHEVLMLTSTEYNSANQLLGYEQAKRTLPWVRPLMIDVGSGMKSIFGKDIFAQAAARRARGLDNVVITDVRFGIEVQVLHSEGFRFVDIRRPEADSNDADEARQVAKKLGLHLPTIENCGTIEELKDQAKLFKPWQDY